jgi:hypothetical protein
MLDVIAISSTDLDDGWAAIVAFRVEREQRRSVSAQKHSTECSCYIAIF